MAAKAGAKAPDTPQDGPFPPDHNESQAGVEGPETTPAPEPELGLAPDDREALLVSHMAQARLDNKALEAAMEVIRGVRKVRNRHRNVCKTDGFSLKVLDEVLADEVRDRLELEDEAEMRTFMRNTARLPVIGRAQMDLFKDVNQPPPRPTGEVGDDEGYFFTEGFNAGFRGLDGKIPDTVPNGPPTQWWTDGWGAGQAQLGKRLKRAEEINEGRLAE